MFDNSVIEKLGYYVYFLTDPRNKQIFYVGKGSGNRIYHHAFDSLKQELNSDKLEIIREIKAQKLEVEYFILRYGLKEETAREIESAVIDILGINQLSNKIRGFDTSKRGLKSIMQIIKEYSAEKVTINDNVLLITINKYFSQNLDSEELYEITRYCWRLNSKRINNVKYILSVYKGIVREVYEVKSWNQVKESINIKDINRWYFNGNVCDKSIREKYINKSVEHYIGGQNPIKYINC